MFIVAELVDQGLARACVWATVLGAPPALVGMAIGVRGEVARKSLVPIPCTPEVPAWAVDRPRELAEVVDALLRRQPGTVGITTALQGAGGFGKTTLAVMASADSRVQRRFRGGIYIVTVGRDVRGTAALAEKVNNVIKLLTGEEATFTDPELAGRRLGALLDTGPRRLLVLDDVWEPEQLAPLTDGGRRCARLVTTRAPGLLAGRGAAVRVDQMSSGQARALLTSDLPPLDHAAIGGLLAVTGRWPLLLRLVSKILTDAFKAGLDVTIAADQLLKRLLMDGPAAVDDLSMGPSTCLEVDKPRERARAVRATILASTSLLGGRDAERFAELGVFADSIPFDLVARLWRVTGGLDELQASGLCARLVELALVSGAGAGEIALHDVVRDFLRSELGPRRLAELNRVLLDEISIDISAVNLPTTLAEETAGTEWWKLGRDNRYLWDHLIEHLRDAGRHAEAENVATDLRWVSARLEEAGPVAAAADLSLVATSRASRLQAVLARTAHLLAPVELPGAVVDVLHSRIASDATWGPQAIALRNQCRRPRLVNRWPLPDLPEPALRRVLTGHANRVTSVAVRPNGSWIATGSSDGTVRVWDAVIGREIVVLGGCRQSGVATVAVAPDGSWLAAGISDGTVRVWDAVSWHDRAVLRGHKGPVNAVAVAPDGSWIATGGWDRTVRVWDAATGRERAILQGHSDWVTSVVVAPDGNWLASGSSDGTVRVWDAVSWHDRAVLRGHKGPVNAVAVAPDGSWIATGGWDRTVRVWDAATGRERAILQGHSGRVTSVAVAPDGNWLATGSDDMTARLWDAVSWHDRAILKGHKGPVNAVVVAPDGSWVVTGSDDKMPRLWDAVVLGQGKAVSPGHSDKVNAVAVVPGDRQIAIGRDDKTARLLDAKTGHEIALLNGHHTGVTSVAVAPDSTLIATGGGWDLTARLWDAETGQEQVVLRGHKSPVNGVAMAPDGSWIATGSLDGTARVWDVVTGRELAVLRGHRAGVTSVAVAPDGNWIVTGSDDRTARVWNVVTERELTALRGHTDRVTSVAVAPDGSWIVTGSLDGTARIWDVVTGRELAVLQGHTDRVTSVAVALDGSWIATGSWDQTARIWCVATGQVMALMRVENIVAACAWLGSEGLAIGGPGGLYVFDFLAGDRLAPRRRLRKLTESQHTAEVCCGSSAC